MPPKPLSLRPFVGSKDFGMSREFYHAIGFTESVIDAKMSYFYLEGRVGFYLQDYYVRDWIDNSMLFLELEDPAAYRQELLELNLPEKFSNVRITEVREESWGREFFLHDPVGVLWHFGSFNGLSTSL